MTAKIIVGLGNPGPQYVRNRHNVGFRAIEAVARAHGLAFAHRYAQSYVARGQMLGVEVALAKPRTFMNLSGDAVLGLLARHRAKPTDLLVVYDDMDLPLGRIRLRARGSAGGHKGIASIIGRLGTQEFARLRIGIGRPEEEEAARYPGEEGAVRHVLSNFRPEEQLLLDEALRRAVAAVECFLGEGIVAAMNAFNG